MTFSHKRPDGPRMTIIQGECVVVANLDKREFVTLTGIPIMAASSNHIPVTERGPSHDTTAQNSKRMVIEHQILTGYFALLSPRSELNELLSIQEVTHESKYGSWYGDRMITYGTGVRTGGWNQTNRGTNPLSSNTNTFTEITKDVLKKMGHDIMTHLQILAE